MSVSITFLGGLGEVGRNCAALEIDGKICLIDVGLMFPEEEMLGVDLVFPDWSWLIERADDIECVLITHGHEDHIGALSYFLKDVNVPVYANEFTLALGRGRIEEMGIDADLRPVAMDEWVSHGSFRFKFLRVTHSIPDACSVVIQTPEGLVVHSGDFKLDQIPVDGNPTNLPAFAELGREGVRLLMADSTNAEQSGSVPSESSLGAPIAAIIREAPGRVLAACFASHMHRIQQLIDGGLAAGRKIAFFGRSLQRNAEVAMSLGRLQIPSNDLLDIVDLLELPEDQQLLITTGSQGEPFAAMSLIALGRHRFVKVQPGDTVIISATPIPGNEAAVSKVISRLLRLGGRVFHGRNAQVHVSGHAARDELLTFLNVIRPQAFVPVHGEYRHLHAHAALARQMKVPWVEVLESGDRVNLSGDETTVDRRVVEAGYVYLDGSSLGDVKRAVLRDRGRLAEEGVVVVTLGVDHQTGSLAYGPDLDSHGMMDDPGDLLSKAAAAVTSAVENQLGEGFNLFDAQQLVKRAVSQVIRAETSRNPVVLPVIMEL